MNKREIKRILSGDLQIPQVVESRFQYALNSIEAQAEPMRGARPVRRMARGLKRTLVIAAVIAALSAGTALAAYISGEHSVFYQTVFGNTSRGNTEHRQEFDERGSLSLNQPQSERVVVDDETAEALVGEYLSGSLGVYELVSYTGQVTTLTIENMLYDLETGAFYMYISFERESGGFPELDTEAAAKWNGEIWFGGDTGLRMGGGLFTPGRMYYDSENSTENKIYLSAAGVQSVPDEIADKWPAMAFGESISVDLVNPEDLKDSYNGVTYLDIAEIELPDIAQRLPSEKLYIGRDLAVTLSAVGIRLEIPILGSQVRDGSDLDYIALEYIDGTRYVIKDDNNGDRLINNYDYALIVDDRVYGLEGTPGVVYCFNRLVDTEQVARVIVNDIELEVAR